MKAVISIVFFIALIGGLFYSMNKVEESAKKLWDAKEQEDLKVGSRVVFDGDTLRMVDYSLLDQTYTLSNGLTVHYKMVEFIEN